MPNTRTFARCWAKCTSKLGKLLVYAVLRVLLPIGFFRVRSFHSGIKFLADSCYKNGIPQSIQREACSFIVESNLQYLVPVCFSFVYRSIGCLTLLYFMNLTDCMSASIIASSFGVPSNSAFSIACKPAYNLLNNCLKKLRLSSSG